MHCPAKMRTKLWKSHIVSWLDVVNVIIYVDNHWRRNWKLVYVNIKYHIDKFLSKEKTKQQSRLDRLTRPPLRHIKCVKFTNVILWRTIFLILLFQNDWHDCAKIKLNFENRKLTFWSDTKITSELSSSVKHNIYVVFFVYYNV